ncbi:MAG: BLUF domain-containing protein [Thioalkalivibrionaceae bacterium]
MTTSYIQLAYASTADFPKAKAGVDVEVGRILRQSRRNNAKRGVVGALYYGDGFFFQCIEGSTDAVESLYATIRKDPRHSDVVELVRRPITQPTFERWQMKYVPADEAVQAMLVRFGLKRFNPYRFDTPLVEAMLELLHRREDAPLPSEQSRPGNRDPERDSIAALAAVQQAVDAGQAANARTRLDAKAPRSERTPLDVIALVIAIAAFLLGAFGIWLR